MNQQKNQDNQSLLDGITSEVSAESAPLMNFIIKHAPFIAGVVLTFLLILAGMGIWRWYHGGKQEEARKELVRIQTQLKGQERDTALSALAENAPASTRLFIYLSLGKSAQENGNPVLAAEAYAKAAQLDGDNALGLTAALSSAGSLLMQAEYVQALAMLEELGAKLPEAQKSMEYQQMLAEAAAKANKTELAQKLYQKLADEVNTPEKSYFQSRANALAEELKKGKTSTDATNDQ